MFHVCTAERKPEINRQSGSIHVCLIITFHIYYIYSYVTFVVLSVISSKTQVFQSVVVKKKFSVILVDLFSFFTAQVTLNDTETHCEVISVNVLPVLVVPGFWRERERESTFLLLTQKKNALSMLVYLFSLFLNVFCMSLRLHVQCGGNLNRKKQSDTDETFLEGAERESPFLV